MWRFTDNALMKLRSGAQPTQAFRPYLAPRLRRSVRVNLAIFSWSIASFAQAAGQVSAQTIAFPPISLGPGEVARVDIVDSAAAYPGWTFITPCDIDISLRGVQSGQQVQKTLKLTNTGQISTFDVPFLALSSGSSPAIVSASISATPEATLFNVTSPPIPPCAMTFSLEVYDAQLLTTHAIVIGQAGQGTEIASSMGTIDVLPCLDGPTLCELQFAFERTPTQTAVIPPIGLAPNESIEIDVAPMPASAGGAPLATCTAAVAFYSDTGLAVGPRGLFTLSAETPPAAAFLAAPSTASRSTIAAQLSLTPVQFTTSYPASTVPACAAVVSARVFDTASGTTHAYVSGQIARPSIPVTRLRRQVD